jgi:hypothetical protein
MNKVLLDQNIFLLINFVLIKEKSGIRTVVFIEEVLESKRQEESFNHLSDKKSNKMNHQPEDTSVEIKISQKRQMFLKTRNIVNDFFIYHPNGNKETFYNFARNHNMYSGQSESYLNTVLLQISNNIKVSKQERNKKTKEKGISFYLRVGDG